MKRPVRCRGFGRWTLGLAVMVCSAIGCVTWRPASTSTGAGSTVRVSFPVPQTIVAETRAGATIQIPGVSELLGIVSRSVADTLYVRVVGGQVIRGSTLRVPRDAVATVPRVSGAIVTEEVANLTMTAVVLLAVVGGVLGFTAIALSVDKIE